MSKKKPKVIEDTGDVDESPTVAKEQMDFAHPGFSWRGQKLQRFALGRELAWHRHRHLLGDVPLEQLGDQIAVVSTDAIRVLWFCSVNPDAWLEFPMGDGFKNWSPRERAQKMEAQIMEWAESVVSADELQELCVLFMAIIKSARSTRPNITPSDGRRTETGN